jgi:hypothetical protein
MLQQVANKWIFPFLTSTLTRFNLQIEGEEEEEGEEVERKKEERVNDVEKLV